ncbi:AraC family transcriptional regulator [Sphingobium sp. AS12]|uniref:AraC family transcriptional regulator n=1 Tax=Sphingobium sp. AS12 TaxID=2849495 RepID=UPI001C31D371|nr:AraC family transcriptional regulator [Sphingobium sp. AS12]MBV2150119.1 AraC family transcriptional regulator [Sphingobium sp. AS12]
MDVLADVLRLASLGNAVITQSEMIAPWALLVPSEIRVAIHLVRRGGCWLRMPGAAPLYLAEGDIVLIPSALAHILSDATDTPPLPLEEGLAVARQRALDGEQGGKWAGLLCAEITFDHAARHPLAGMLPEVIHIPSDEAKRGEALPALARMLLEEVERQRAGSEIVVARLLDALLVLIVRHWLETQTAPNAGWLGALRDPKILRALSAMHHDPRHSWSVAELAARAGMSRAAFARRFSRLVGQAPLGYLAQWRMNVAAKLLRSTESSVENVALSVGYDSATAFGNAFRRHFSISPGRYRTR